MSRCLTIEVVVEGPTEHEFVTKVLQPYWAPRGIFVEAPIVRTRIDRSLGRVYTGGDIRFSRVAKQIGNFLKQRPDVLVASFVDYYGVKEWPGLDAVRESHSPSEIAGILNRAALEAIQQVYSQTKPQERYFPFTAVHEFEALLYSDAGILARCLHIDRREVDSVLRECGGPEAINNSPDTAPSKRLEKWMHNQYGKTTTGIAIAQAIGIDRMRESCPNFDAWLSSVERLQS